VEGRSLDDLIAAKEVFDDACSATASLRASVKEIFFSARINCTLCSNFHLGHELEDAA